jgi:hypothetical protein
MGKNLTKKCVIIVFHFCNSSHEISFLKLIEYERYKKALLFFFLVSCSFLITLVFYQFKFLYKKSGFVKLVMFLAFLLLAQK